MAKKGEGRGKGEMPATLALPSEEDRFRQKVAAEIEQVGGGRIITSHDVAFQKGDDGENKAVISMKINVTLKQMAAIRQGIEMGVFNEGDTPGFRDQLKAMLEEGSLSLGDRVEKKRQKSSKRERE